MTRAARSGSTRELLVAIRDRLARVLDDDATPAYVLAGLAGRLAEVMRELETADAKTEAAAVLRLEDEPFDGSSL